MLPGSRRKGLPSQPIEVGTARGEQRPDREEPAVLLGRQTNQMLLEPILVAVDRGIRGILTPTWGWRGLAPTERGSFGSVSQDRIDRRGNSMPCEHLGFSGRRPLLQEKAALRSFWRKELIPRLLGLRPLAVLRTMATSICM